MIGTLAAQTGTPLRGLTFATLLLAGACGACGVQEGIPGYPGQPAPEFSAPDLSGDTVSLASLRDDVVLLNLWATWCPPCRVEMPHLQALHEEFADRGLRVVGVSVDSEGSSGTVVRFLDDLDIDFLILRDPAERVPHLYRAIGLPLSVLIDREGIIRWRHNAPVTADDPRLRAVLDELLSDG